MRLAFTVPPGNGPGLRYARYLGAALRSAGHEAALGSERVLDDGVPVVDGALLPGPVPPAAFALLHRVPGDWDPAAFRGLIATSPAVLKRLEQAGQRADLVMPGIGALPRAAGSGGPGCAILSVGAITARKGHDALLRALGRLADLDWTLTIAGSTAEAPVHPPTLMTLAEELGIGQRVRLVPDPGDAALDALWHENDLFALTSSWEGYPASLAEALRRGIPAVVSDETAAALPQLGEASWGVSVPASDVEGLSKAMRRLIYDRALRHDLADGAWQAGRALPGWAEQARRFVAVIERAGEGAGP